MKRIAVVFAVAGLSAPFPAEAQQPFEVAVPQDQLDCLVENQEKYLAIPRPIIDFYVDLCPAITGEEAAALALNSGDANTEVRSSLLMTKGDFRCLLGKIGEHLEASQANEAQDELPPDEPPPDEPPFGEIVFVLDCPQ